MSAAAPSLHINPDDAAVLNTRMSDASVAMMLGWSLRRVERARAALAPAAGAALVVEAAPVPLDVPAVCRPAPWLPGTAPVVQSVAGSALKAVRGLQRMKPINADILRWTRAYAARGVETACLADLFDVDADALEAMVRGGPHA